MGGDDIELDLGWGRRKGKRGVDCVFKGRADLIVEVVMADAHRSGLFIGQRARWPWW